METNTSITITDLTQLKAIIEMACSRGAFQAAEMRTVGELYEKLGAFLAQAAAMVEAQKPQPEGESS